MKRFSILGILLCTVWLASPDQAFAQRGRGGGGGGRGGAPVNRTPSFSRPAAPAARPAPRMAAPSRPSFGNVQRPSGNLPRPSMGTIGRPAPAARPNVPSRPQVNVPQRPGGIGNVPSVGRPNVAGRPSPGTIPGAGRPNGTGRPSFGNLPNGGNRPGTGNPGVNRPPITSRPGGPGTARPNPWPAPNRPGIVNRPDGGGRPGVGNMPGNRPIGPGRPGPGGGAIIDNRPSGRPGGGNFVNNRPNFGGNTNRPIIGNTNISNNIRNRPIIGNNNTINNNIRNSVRNNFNNTNINNTNVNNFTNQNFGGRGGRGWNNGWNTWGGPWGGRDNGWGWGGGGWNNWGHGWRNWNANCWNHRWFNGTWNCNYGGFCPAPWIGGLAGWGLGSLAFDSGFLNYYNPYCVPQPVTVPWCDYSQPLVIADYLATPMDVGQPVDIASVSAVTPEQPANSPEVTAALKVFDDARTAFYQGSYEDCLRLTDQALSKTPNDLALQEFRALVLFAIKDYRQAAAVLNSLLASAPGWDWTTMISLYPNVGVYTQELRDLEAYRRQHPDAADARFVLAYQYIVDGHTDAAVRELREVVRLQPKDQVSARLLQSLTQNAGERTMAYEPPQAPPGAPPTAAVQQPAQKPGPTTDLVGTWRAKNKDGTTLTLNVQESGNFDWRFAKGDKEQKIDGRYTLANDLLILESQKEGTMIGRVTSGGPDRFTYQLTDGPTKDSEMVFTRVR